MNYTVFDVETANSQRASICSIGIIRCENDAVVFEKEFLINPETEFNYFNIRVHGITENMIKDKPAFPEVWDEIKPYFSNTILVAHNAKSMDLCALYRTLERYNIPLVNNEYICTLELSRSILGNELDSFKLNVICKYFGIELNNHHDALCDTRACHRIFCKLRESYKQEITPETYVFSKNSSCDCESSFSGLEKIYKNETKDMQELEVLVKGIIEDNRVSVEEFEVLNRWLEVHDYLLGYYPFDKIYNLVEEIIEDGVIDESEEKDLLKLLDRFINPETEKAEISIAGKKVCLSGEFDYGSKKEVENYITLKGGEIVKTVSSKIDILILGEAGSAAWKYGNYGSKYEKARQLIEKGKNIKIYKERDIISK